MALIPWMVAAAAVAQDEIRPAEVVFGHHGAWTGQAWQIRSECYVPMAALESWGLPARLQRFEVAVEAEGQSHRVPFRTQAGQTVVPLGELARRMGAHFGWVPGSSRFEVWSPVRSITFADRRLDVEAGFLFRTRVGRMVDPDRMVVDLIGVRLGADTQIEVPDGVRVSQHQDQIVRIVIETADRPDWDAQARPARRVSLEFGPRPGPAAADPSGTPLAAPAGPSPDEPGLIADPLVRPPVPNPQTGPDRPESLPYDTEPPAEPRSPARIGDLRLVSENNEAATFHIPLEGSLWAPPVFQRPIPNVLEIVMPGGVQALGDLASPSPSVTRVERVSTTQGSVIRLTLVRPMGVEISTAGSAIVVHLIKPQVGDGRLAGKTIVVDPGHGGHDSGAISPNRQVREKDVVLRVGTAIARQLSQQGATVILTRRTDVFIPLRERSAIATRNRADFFISVHVNSNRRARSASGIKTFHHGGSALGQLLAECLHGPIVRRTRLPDMKVWRDTRITESGFSVLRNATMPAVLLELGFINNDRDRARMVQPTFADDVAQAVVEGLKVYLGNG
ncbi:MAG: N-acetylmuramoyl-L-alanine amidase [Fimbriimonadaceae bacterium]